MAGSAVPGFYKKDREERLRIAASIAGLSEEDLEVLRSGGVGFERADKMVENAIGTFPLPLGVATNFVINGRDCLVPMAIEEPSVIAAASKAAKAARGCGGFAAEAGKSYVTGQVQLVGHGAGAAQKIADSEQEILALANSQSRTLSAMNRGATKVTCREIEAESCTMLLVEILVDAGDAMGANITNAMCEAVSPLLERITSGRAILRILSNYSTQRLARASATFPRDEVGGADAVRDVVLAYELADADVYRAVTHNKGVMNGIVAVANATGQDSRAIEAAAGAYAARSGRYRSLTKWEQTASGDLAGSIELPLSVGVVGGVANVHPLARVCIKMLGASSAQELACAMASAGLAQNYAALRALAAEGIQSGHMRLHARNIAAAAGAAPEQIDGLVRDMIRLKKISPEGARELLGA